MSIFAIDLGGTNIRAAAVERTGMILADDQAKTPKDLTPNGLVALISKLHRGLAKKAGGNKKFAAAAIAVPAPAAENGDGMLSKVPNIPSLEGMQLLRPVSEALGLPVVIENDATAAAIGENWVGASRKVNTSILLTLGTGIGGGLIINGEAFRGPDGSAGEIGHFCVEPDGYACGCGSRGCLEQYGSAQAVMRMANELGMNAGSSEAVYRLAVSGDRDARRIFSEMGKYLGIVSAGLINTLDPDMVVFGGKVAGAFVLFSPRLRSEIRSRAFPAPAVRCRIVKGKLGDHAGLIGAARSAILRFG